MLLPSQMKYSAPTAIWNALRFSWCQLRTDQETNRTRASISASEIVPVVGRLGQDELGVRLVGREEPLLDREERVGEPDPAGHRPVEPVAEQALEPLGGRRGARRGRRSRAS